MTLDLEHMKRVAEALNPSTPLNEWQQACCEANKPEFAATVLRMLEGLALLEGMAGALEYCNDAPAFDAKMYELINQALAAYKQWKEK